MVYTRVITFVTLEMRGHCQHDWVKLWDDISQINEKTVVIDNPYVEYANINSFMTSAWVVFNRHHVNATFRRIAGEPNKLIVIMN